MKVILGLDRGNGATKAVASGSGRQVSIKIPNVIVQGGDGVTIGRAHWLLGRAALLSDGLARLTPLGQGDKVEVLAPVVAWAIHEFCKGLSQSPSAVELHLAVSSPYPGIALEKAIAAELKPLSKGYSVGQAAGPAIALASVSSGAEGVSLLSDSHYGAVVDLGYGTMIAGVAHPIDGIRPIALPGGEERGMNGVIADMMASPDFLAACRAAKLPSIPGEDLINYVLGEGRLTMGVLDMKPLLVAPLRRLLQRIDYAALPCIARGQALTATQQALAVEAAGLTAITGGGAMLLQSVLDPVELSGWLVERRCCIVAAADWANATAMHQLAKAGQKVAINA